MSQVWVRSRESLAMWAARMRSMMGMISVGVGFGPGVRIWRRLQRALRYGISRVESRAASSERDLGKGMSQVSIIFKLRISDCGLRIFSEVVGIAGFGFLSM